MGVSLSVSAENSADNFDALASKCAPDVSKDTLHALVLTESSMNPYAVAVVGQKVTQPISISEALSLVKKLDATGANYSLGLGQINVKNFKTLGVTAEEMFDPCENLKATQYILKDCFVRAKAKDKSQGKQLGDALSCYYSGNEKTRYKGYVQKVIANSDKYTSVRIPSIKEAKKELNNSPATSAGSESIVISSDHVTGSLISSNSAPSGLIF
ncbi:MAG: lytic transglycosylase domain-containing protein [Succinivibrio sp.]